MNVYAIRSQYFVIRDSPEQLGFHAKCGDYFSHLAAMMGFFEEALAKCGSTLTEREKGMARELRHDLRYMQANYKIVPRELEEIETIRPSGNLLAK